MSETTPSAAPQTAQTAQPARGASGRMPTIFLAHGSPATVADGSWMGQLNQWAQDMPRPKSVLMISAHWEERPLTIGATETKPLIYDFYGFPEEFYRLQYASPGAPELAQRVRELVGTTQQVAEEPERGLDHGDALAPILPRVEVSHGVRTVP